MGIKNFVLCARRRGGQLGVFLSIYPTFAYIYLHAPTCTYMHLHAPTFDYIYLPLTTFDYIVGVAITVPAYTLHAICNNRAGIYLACYMQ